MTAGCEEDLPLIAQWPIGSFHTLPRSSSIWSPRPLDIIECAFLIDRTGLDELPELESLPRLLTWMTFAPDSGVTTVHPFWSETDRNCRGSSCSSGSAPATAFRS